jgi:hypothetical protein
MHTPRTAHDASHYSLAGRPPYRLNVFRAIGDHEMEWDLPCPLNHHAIDAERQRKGFAVLVPIAAHRWIRKDLL